MADLNARKQVIREASAHVRNGSVWLRRAADTDTWKTVAARRDSATPAAPARRSKQSRP